MSADPTAQQKNHPQTHADKTYGTRLVREDSVTLMETDDYVSIEPSTPLVEAIERMKEVEGGCAIVCEGRRVVGIFTERDLLTKVIGEEVDLSTPVRELMSPVVAMLTSEATIGDAVRVMGKSHRDIPLVKDGELIGSISVFDVITYLAESYPKETMILPPVPAQVVDTPEGEVAQTIFEKVKDLPPEQQHAILHFVERLATAGAQSNQTIWEEIRKIAGDVPDEVWEQLPRDGSLNVDHYLYGAPKK